MKPSVESRLAKLFLAASGAAVALLLLELVARVYLFGFASYEQKLFYASVEQLEALEGVKPRFSPHRYLGYYPTPGYSKGENRHDSSGFRGEELAVRKSAGSYRIVCLGGSATYSDGVEDYRKSFPDLLERELSDLPVNVEVVNAGVPGYSSLESLLSFQIRILDLEPDLVVVYHGWNDAGARLVWPPSGYRGDHSGFNGVSFGDRKRSVAEHSTFLRMIFTRLGWMEPQTSLRTWFGAHPATSYLTEYSRQVAAGTYPQGIFMSVPAEKMLEANRPIYFRRNLENLSAVAAANGIEVLFLSFAYSTSPEWPGAVGRPEFRAALAEMNEVVRSVAEQRGDFWLDLASALPDDRGLYTDGYHFTELGNRARAERVGAAIRERIPQLMEGGLPVAGRP